MGIHALPLISLQLIELKIEGKIDFSCVPYLSVSNG